MSRFLDLLERLRSYAPQPCMEGDGSSHSYAQLLNEYEHWQSRLDERGIAPGTVVGLRADYSVSAVAALLALFARGAVAALIPRDRDVTQYLVDAHTAALLELDVQGSYQWHSVPHPADHPLIGRLRAAGQGGVVLFTSGSTGRPKAALQSVDRFLYKFLKSGRRFRTLAFLLFDHIAGLDTLFYTLAAGGTLILTRRRDPFAILELIESRKIEVLPASPSFLRLLSVAGDCGGHDVSSLEIITYGAEPMDHVTLARLNAQFPYAQLIQKYGTTETGSPRSISRGKDSLWLKIKSDGVETKVADGLLWIRSEGVMLGYLNAPSPVDEQGWYCTGDLVEFDGEWIRFRGRAADTINVGGEKVAPAEVEQTILELDAVRDVVVSGEPHPLLGQVVSARVALATSTADPKEAVKRIRSHCRQRLARYKVPIRVEIVTEGLANDRQKARRKGISE